ncbi:Lymphocyte antigen 75 [Amphibalanus amphitrite]|uniref:Lymphocyte antigen 75 n=1 Tax=Amphibalanus amphitrite TaxID=1232801 RepID=A0A6A4X0H4_AMPAM|nr:Lymphocyte antigen 75 [Amphibalanus amphitrite]
MRCLLAVCAALVSLLAAAAAEDCPDGFEDLGLGDNHCYMYANESNSWTLAYTACLTSANGTGNLLSLSDANSFYPQYYKVTEAEQDYWTGLLNVGGEKSWADGTPYVGSEIDQFIAEDAGNDLYGYMSGKDGLFRFDNASTQRPYICYVDLTEAPTTTAPPPTQPPCEAGWLQYGEVCYLFSDDQQYWGSAGHACHLQGAELISINNSQLLTFLLLSADDSIIYWTGLENQNETYVWEDGTSADNVPDVLGPYLDDWAEGSDCVALNAGAYPDPPLQHLNCLTEQNYICYKQANSDELFDSGAGSYWL